MAEVDYGHQIQMIFRPLAKALQQGNLDAAMRFAGHLFDIGGDPAEVQARKVHFLVKAMEGATPSVRTEFTAKFLDQFGPNLTEESKSRLEGRLDRL